MAERRDPPNQSGFVIAKVSEAVWSWRVELACLLALAMIGWWTARVAGRAAGVVLALLLGVAILLLPPTRRPLRTALAAARVRRAWEAAVRRAALPALRGLVPGVLSTKPVPAGEWLTVAVPYGCQVDDLVKAKETLAAALEARSVRVEPVLENARRANVLIVRRDPLVDSGLSPWPLLDAVRTSLWAPIPVGFGEDGQQIRVELPERNMLLGGEPGAGKSAALSLLLAAAALDPFSVLWLFDGKQVELACWSGVSRRLVGPDLDEAIDVLRALRVEMDARYAELLAAGCRKIDEGSEWPLQVVAIDELAFYLTGGERKARTELADLIRDLVARGRAAGFVVLASTQKPAGDIIPTSLRDLFGFRWSLRCSTPQASDTILGSGWASAGYSSADIDAAHRGVGYLLHEGGRPIRLRSYYLDDSMIASLAQRAQRVRLSAASTGDGGAAS